MQNAGLFLEWQTAIRTKRSLTCQSFRLLRFMLWETKVKLQPWKPINLEDSLAFCILSILFTLDHLQQFEILKRGEVTSFGQPYDFQSIMHYSNKEFSKNGADTIRAISDPSMQLGNVNSLSAVDVLQINLLYNCPEALKQGTHKGT